MAAGQPTVVLQGVETLSLRMDRHWSNAAKVAEFLTKQSKVESVSWAGLPSSPWHERAKKYFGGKGYGSVIAFVVKGGRENGQKFAEAQEIGGEDRGGAPPDPVRPGSGRQPPHRPWRDH